MLVSLWKAIVCRDGQLPCGLNSTTRRPAAVSESRISPPEWWACSRWTRLSAHLCQLKQKRWICPLDDIMYPTVGPALPCTWCLISITLPENISYQHLYTPIYLDYKKKIALLFTDANNFVRANIYYLTFNWGDLNIRALKQEWAANRSELHAMEIC